jgi:hypothetical protein
MTLPAFAADSDLDPGESFDSRRAVWALNRASTAIRGETGRSWVDDDGALISLTPMSAELLREVAVGAATRLLRNPDGATSRSETLGPMTESVTVEAPALYFTRAEKEMLTTAVSDTYPLGDGGFLGLGTIPTTRGPIETASVCATGYIGWPDDNGDPE